MDRDQLEGLVRYISGKFQEKYGRLTGDSSREFEGVTRQIEGKLQSRGFAPCTAVKREKRRSCKARY